MELSKQLLFTTIHLALNKLFNFHCNHWNLPILLKIHIHLIRLILNQNIPLLFKFYIVCIQDFLLSKDAQEYTPGSINQN